MDKKNETKTKVKHDYKCECGKVATRTIENVVQEYAIDNDGDMELVETTSSDYVTKFLCDDCYQKRYR